MPLICRTLLHLLCNYCQTFWFSTFELHQCVLLPPSIFFCHRIKQHVFCQISFGSQSYKIKCPLVPGNAGICLGPQTTPRGLTNFMLKQWQSARFAMTTSLRRPDWTSLTSVARDMHNSV